MTRVKPLAANELGPQEQAMADAALDMMGFVPNDLLIMARWPQLAQAMLPVVELIYGPGEVSMELKRMVAAIASVAGGCQYCVAHTAHGLDRVGASAEKQAAIWEFDTHPLVSDAERAALDYARAAGQNPSAVNDGHFERLRAHFSDRQILEITSVVALFGFLNRWNASLGVPLEEAPLNFAREHLSGTGWTPGVHTPADGD